MELWIGPRLKLLLGTNAKKQKELAAVVNHSQSWMSDVLNGKKDPGFHEVEAMLRALGCPWHEGVKNPGAITGVNVTFDTRPASPTDPDSGAGGQAQA